ncbi:MAG: alpha/beta fold hydrolase [Acidimicrobiales bacterium]
MLASIERGSGPPVLLLHGQPGTGAAFGPLMARLVLEFRVLAPDRTGYGSSPGEAVGLAATADQMADFLTERGAAPAAVVAHSWSGGAAVLLASRYPTLVQSLVLVGAACTPDSIGALDRWLTVPLVGDALTVVGLAGIGSVLPWVRRLVLPFMPAGRRDQVASTLPDRSVMQGASGALGRHKRSFMIEQRALVDELPVVTAALGTLDLPVAVVCGQWDLVVPPRAAATLAEAVAGARLTIVRAGHFVARDNPAALVEVIRAVTRAGPSDQLTAW